MAEKLTYYEQLKHPKWQKRRLHMLELSNWKCFECGVKDVSLHVHHKQYIKGRMAWEYDDDELVVLCEECHEIEHAIAAELKDLLCHVNTLEALALLRGYHLHADWFDPLLGDMGRDRDYQTYVVGFVASLMRLLKFEDLKKIADFTTHFGHEDSEERKHFENSLYLFGEK